jgi:hypothetical protein
LADSPISQQPNLRMPNPACGWAKVLVVGLGNPGIEYQFTPHNAGFLAIDRIAENYGVGGGKPALPGIDGDRQDRE